MDEAEWWGHHPEQGWVVTFTKFKNLGTPPLPFFRCIDAQIVWIGDEEIKRVVHGPFFYGQMREPGRSVETAKFQPMRDGWLQHKQRFGECTRDVYIPREVSPRPRPRPRVAHCFSCHEILYGTSRQSCPDCGWIKCECGACGCSYHNP